MLALIGQAAQIARRQQNEQRSAPRPIARGAWPRGRGRFAWPLGLVMALGLGIPWASVQAQEMASTPAAATVEAGVDINHAGAAEIAGALTGVGMSKAEAIVRYREQFGPFESVEELTEVKGIGAATLERNRARIRLQ